MEDETDHWYEFLYNDTTGAEIEGDPTSGYTITLHFVDNSRGDSDTASGAFRDPGAPVFIAHTTPPVISPSVDGTLGTNGWYISDVSVSWSVSDEESAIQSSQGCDPKLVSSDTSEITFTCTAASLGGTSSESVTIKRDTVVPTITYISRTESNTKGWNNMAVTVEWACADDLSGPAAETVSQILSGQGADQGGALCFFLVLIILNDFRC